MNLQDSARKIAASYDPKLISDEAIVTVRNGDLRELSEALALKPDWTGFDHPGSEVASPKSL
jgi:hypothetical protein